MHQPGSLLAAAIRPSNPRVATGMPPTSNVAGRRPAIATGKVAVDVPNASATRRYRPRIAPLATTPQSGPSPHNMKTRNKPAEMLRTRATPIAVHSRARARGDVRSTTQGNAASAMHAAVGTSSQVRISHASNCQVRATHEPNHHVNTRSAVPITARLARPTPRRVATPPISRRCAGRA